MAFLDLSGASGAAYRFRLWPDDNDHPPIAGNFVVVRGGLASLEVLAIGVTNDLSQAKEPFRSAADERVYTRLNVSRTTREAEHADLTARFATARVLLA